MSPAKQNRVFVWSDYRQWRATVLWLMRDLIDQSVLKELKQNPPRYFISGNLTWFDDAIRKIKGGPSLDCCAILVERLSIHYRFVRAFHGCRSDSTKSYQANGLLPCNPSNLDTLAVEIFQNKKRVQEAIRDAAINDGSFSYREHNQGKVFFCLESEELTEHCGHYLLYGSEYLLGIASQVGERDALRKRGRATLIECNVPISDISEEYMKCLAGEILKMIAEKYCVRPYCPQSIGFGFHINNKLAPENIVAFHFPKQIPNPHNFLVPED